MVPHFLKKKKKKKKRLHLVRVRKKAAAWEQVSHNDAALTDVGQLFISLPKSVPTGAQADTVHTHALLSLGRQNILARFFWDIAKDET